MTYSISETAHKVFCTADAGQKAQSARAMFKSWDAGLLEQAKCQSNLVDRPARPNSPEVRLPADMPKRRRGGTLENRKSLLHAIAHIELNAIDLAVDMIARFGADMGPDFVTDWVSVANDEARHYQLLEKRLIELNSFYGALPAHDGLWQAAYATRYSVDARLAVVPMVLEARGLDVTPMMIQRLKAGGDPESARILTIIYTEEIRHVAIGTKWFRYQCLKQNKKPEPYFHELVRRYFHGNLKPPFNHPARNEADMPRDFYEPLAQIL